MARGEWGGQGRWKCSCSYKKTTLIVCCFNIAVALFVLRSLYASLYVYPNSDSVVKYTQGQLRKMEESIRIRKASEPIELVKLVKKVKRTLSREENVVELPQSLKQKLANEILLRLRSLNAGANVTEQRDAVESWRKEKLEEAEQATLKGRTMNTTFSHEEYGILVRALDSSWSIVSEEIGLWIPAEVLNAEHDDKPPGIDDLELEILPGRPLPPECHAELHTDYDGTAVRWGLTHPKESAADCCQACLDQAKNARPGEKKCNIWVYCPSETGCHSPDIYEHKNMECWLKYAEKPKQNFKDKYPESYRDSHPSAPAVVPWVSGVVSA